jgi:hypothetical protein
MWQDKLRGATRKRIIQSREDSRPIKQFNTWWAIYAAPTGFL